MGSGTPSYLKNCDLLLLCSRRKLLACTHALLFHLTGKKKKEKLEVTSACSGEIPEVTSACRTMNLEI